ncbi:MAG: sigma-54-dependent transcriptional regulator [Pseudobdellovibrionaceae bacterium]
MSQIILVVDDQPQNLALLKLTLEPSGFTVHQSSSAGFAVSLLKKNLGQYALAIVDYHMPEICGDQATQMLHAIDPQLQVIAMTGDDSDETAEKCLRAGAFLVLQREVSTQRLLAIVESYCGRHSKRKSEISNATETLDSRDNELISRRPLRNEERLQDNQKYIKSFGMVGASDSSKHICNLIEKYAPKSECVLISGENGTGKEKIARALHQKSTFREGPFIPVNCGAISSSLFESELFGHSKGAFTGAMTAKKGYIREAEGGTLFLDEIGDLPLSLQVKLLRVLQEKEIVPVGTSQPIKFNARVIAATNVRLLDAVKNGDFRQDLYYRLNVLNIEIDPLRKRLDDIEPLIEFFLSEWNRKTGEERSVSFAVVEKLKAWSWQGNVRELEHVMSRMLSLHNEQILNTEHIEKKYMLKAKTNHLQIIDNVTDLWNEHQRTSTDEEKKVLSKIISMAGTLTNAARLTGIPKSTLHNKLKGLGLQFIKPLAEENK